MLPKFESYKTRSIYEILTILVNIHKTIFLQEKTEMRLLLSTVLKHLYTAVSPEQYVVYKGIGLGGEFPFSRRVSIYTKEKNDNFFISVSYGLESSSSSIDQCDLQRKTWTIYYIFSTLPSLC